ncbi:hypothetical protein QUA54_28680 [Microcoleus sp. MOSTC5]|uniref:hypothetical protein n=1 Tax=Microcoleus sp. MOSTC5 TaxID=3055378 RepID=UPI002FD25DB6
MTTHLWQEQAVEENGLTTVSATIETANQAQYRLWYRVQAEHGSLLTQSCDPFVVATIFIAMKHGTDMVVHGEVSPSLLQNLAEFQAAWACWRSDLYKQVEITPEVEREQPVANRVHRVISAFSGGVDSCLTAFRHSQEGHSRVQRPLQAGLMVHGLDIPLSEPQIFNRAAQKSRLTLASLGLELIPMVTNFREFEQDWEDSHGVAVASCLMLLQGGYSEGLIPSSLPYHALVLPWGSNPLTDPLLSSRTFAIVHDGAAFTRAEKVKQLAQWREALQNLRVCWEGDRKDRNCGHCEKCIQTILNFRAVGLGLPPCFDQDIADEEILQVLKKTLLIDYALLLADAKANSISDSWVTNLEKFIARNQGHISLVGAE